MIRRRIEEDDDNPERWLVSYADFITLLFAFFVVMYSVSSFKKVQHDELTQAINKAFSNKTKSVETANSSVKPESKTDQVENPPLPADLKAKVAESERDAMTTLGQAVAQILAPLIKNQQAEVMQNSSGLHILILDKALFANGSADLTELGNVTIAELAGSLHDSQHAILVEGHSDNTPIHIKNAALFSNWELSAVRASSIINMLNHHGVQKSRLSALGYGPSQPMVSNETPKGQAINRRMSILVLYDSISLGHERGVVIKPKSVNLNGPKS